MVIDKFIKILSISQLVAPNLTTYKDYNTFLSIATCELKTSNLNEKMHLH